MYSFRTPSVVQLSLLQKEKEQREVKIFTQSHIKNQQQSGLEKQKEWIVEKNGVLIFMFMNC